MSNLTKNKQPNWTGFQPPPKQADYPVYQHNGTNYRIVPETELRKLQVEKDGAFWLTIGAGLLIVGIGANIAAWIASRPATATPQPMIVEKPVVVEREKVVPTNCLMFCGQK